MNRYKNVNLIIILISVLDQLHVQLFYIHSQGLDCRIVQFLIICSWGQNLLLKLVIFSIYILKKVISVIYIKHTFQHD